MAKIQSPSGTRDMYPADLLKRRYIEKLWRDTSIRHGFEEIDGPTFESADLYAVKSGEGILSEVFQVFSGKDEAEVARIRGGANAPYALRPEFTPTLARMYAAKAGSLAKPTKWFWQQNCFRAEKQQRGRLREFGQWNCDILGGDYEPDAQARVDVDVVACVVGLLGSAGLSPKDASVRFSSRATTVSLLRLCGVDDAKLDAALAHLDKRGKQTDAEWLSGANNIHLGIMDFWAIAKTLSLTAVQAEETLTVTRKTITGESAIEKVTVSDLHRFVVDADAAGLSDWIALDMSVARGLAYYTGTVFEVLADGERAIAGGGRYDNLIELFGGPATPAVGFGMGDVVLSLVLQDRGLLPEGDALMDALSRPSASYRPDVFVIPAGQSPEEQEAAAKAVRPLVAKLRRGVESEAYLSREGRKPWDADRYALASNGAPPLHARSSSKATKNIGKLLQDAAGQKAKLAVIVENADEVTIKDLRTNQQDATRTKIADLGRVVAERLGM
jgi:histidyl-tRNA synthetase